MLLPLCFAALGCAAVPAALTVLNLWEYGPPPPSPAGLHTSGEPSYPGTDAASLPPVAVCIPARNEAAGIAACVMAVMASRGVDVEVIVVDDSSIDATATIVHGLARADTRLRLLTAPPLPPGWNGKQHACAVAAAATRAPVLCFLDADVRLEPAALARMAALLGDTGPDLMPRHKRDAPVAAPRVGLVSGFPLEETGTPLEWLLLPLIHYVLLGFLPLSLLRRTTLPGFAAGCGQFLMVDRAAYLASGGHAAIHHTMHDGVLLPRLLRRHGYATRLADLTGLARCRMYTSATATWRGLAKNATEGLAAPGAIVPFTLMLGLGQVLPVPLLVAAILHTPNAVPWAWAAVVLSYLPRLLEVRRFQQRPLSAALHPVGVATLLVLQWYAFFRKLLRRPAQWKERAYTAN